jgi:putative ABC transport system permease protein
MISDFKHAARLLWKSPALTVPAILVLAIGIGATTAVFSLVNSVLLRPLSYPHYERLFYVWENGLGYNRIQIPFEIYANWRERQQSFSDLSILCASYLVFKGESETEQLTGSYVSANYFSVVEISPLLGRYLTDAEDSPSSSVVVLSERIWRRVFHADPKILGRSIALGSRLFEVIGVAPDEMHEAVSWKADFYLSVYADPSKDSTMASGNHMYTCLGRLKPSVSSAQALTEVTGLLRAWKLHNPGKEGGMDAHLEPILDLSVSQYKPTFWLLCGAVGCVLLIACANVANLLFARSAGRLSEICVRLAIGASRRKIFCQLFAESLLLAALGAAAGALVSICLNGLVRTLAPADVPRFQQVSFDLNSFWFVILCTVATALLFGTLPAWKIANDTLPSDLKGRGFNSTPRQRIQAALVIGQLVIAATLMVSAGLLIRTFQGLQDNELGFDPHKLLLANIVLDETRYATRNSQISYWDRLLQKLGRLPGVHAVALNWNPPFYGDGPRNPFTIVGQPDPEPGKEPLSQEQIVSSNYFQAAGIGLKRGRLFDGRDISGSEPVVTIDEHLAQTYFPGQDALGREISDPPGNGRRRHWTIVGIVSSAHHDSMGDAPELAQTYYPVTQRTTYASTVLLRCEVPPESMIDPVRKAVLDLDPGQPVAGVTTMDKVLTNKLIARRLSMSIVTTLSCAALLLATVGLYGTLSHTVAQRGRELGIRVALGAQMSEIMRFVFYRGFRLVAIGAVLGSGCAWGTAQLIKSYLYGVTPTDPLSLGIAAAVLFVASFLACLLPAFRAVKIDPIRVLREE